MGSNVDEGSYFVPVPKNITVDGFNSFVLNFYGPQIGPQVLKLYPPSAYPATPFASPSFYAAEHIWGDFGMTCPARRAVSWFSRKQRGTYLYQFTRIPTGAQFSYHSCEIPFVFLAKDLLLSADDLAISLSMSTLWNTFARTGAPSAPDVWPAYTPASDKNLFIDTKLSVGSGLRKPQCDLWDSLLTRACEAW